MKIVSSVPEMAALLAREPAPHKSSQQLAKILRGLITASIERAIMEDRDPVKMLADAFEVDPLAAMRVFAAYIPKEVEIDEPERPPIELEKLSDEHLAQLQRIVESASGAPLPARSGEDPEES